jgi:hypothetical protein
LAIAQKLMSLVLALSLLAPTPVAAQEVTCRSLSDEEALKFVTERGQLLVRGSGMECKAGDALIQIRFRIIDHTARYDCEIRAKGEKPYCWRLS